jgi:hypothetical protein
MKIPKIFVPEKDLEGEVEKLLGKNQLVKLEYDKLEILYAGTYAGGIAELKNKDWKPLTFYENVEVRIANYKFDDKNAESFKYRLDSVTGIVYKAYRTKFKLILRSDKLENIGQGFKQHFIPIDYDAEKGIELDSKKGKYNQSLTRREAKNHEFWLAAMNGDKKRLAKFVDLWFDKTGEERGMGIYLRSNTMQDELRELVFGYDFSGSNAVGDSGLELSVMFVSCAQ